MDNIFIYKLNFWQCFFNIPYNKLSIEVIYFHGYLFSLVLILIVFIFWILFEIILSFKEYTYINEFFNQNQKDICKTEDFYRSLVIINKIYLKRYAINYNAFLLLEFWWTIIPSIIILILSIFSFLLYYNWDTSLDSYTTDFLQTLLIKIRGSQWFWTYNIFLNNKNTDFEYLFLNGYQKKDFSGYSYIINRLWNFEAHINTNSAFNKKNLETIDNLIIPIQKLIKFIITSSDVIHSWAVPSFGIKVDAIPGRVNIQSIILHLKGIVYGQCSEICGIKHAFMPICIEIENMANWLQHIFTNNNTQPYWLISKIYKNQYDILINILYDNISNF